MIPVPINIKKKKVNDWGIHDFSEGMIDRVDENLLPENAARDCCNWICKTMGILEKRTGQTRLNAVELSDAPVSLYAYYTSNLSTRKLLAVAGTKLLVWNPTNSVFDELKNDLTDGAVMEFETCANYMVGFNNTDNPIKWDGTTVSTLSNAPVGSNPILFKEFLFVVPASAPSQIWWSEVFEPENWPAAYYATVNDGDGDSIASMKVLLNELIIFKHNSIHSLKGSDISDFRLTEIDNRVGCVGSKAACVYGTKIFFVSEQGLYSFNGLSATSITADRIPRLWGDIDKKYLSKACVIPWDDMIHFALPLRTQITLQVTAACSTAGSITVSLGGVEETVAVDLTDDTVDKVATKIKALTFDGWTLSGATDTVIFTRDELRQPLTLTLSAGATGVAGTVSAVEQTVNNFVLVYDPKNGRFFPMKNINASCFEIFNDGDSMELYSGDSADGYINLQDTGTEDFDSPISAYWVGKSFDQGKPGYFKTAKKAFIEDYPNQTTPVTLELSMDYGDFHEWVPKKNDGLIREYRVQPEYKDKWRYITPKFSHSSAGKCEVRGLSIPYGIKSKPKGRTPV